MIRVGSSMVCFGMALSLVSCQTASGPGTGSVRPAPATASAPEPETGAPPGPYTSEQATRGEATFERACSRCHETERFSTAAFFRTWTRAPLSQLYGFISTTMPRGAPGSLSRPQYADVVAYLLALNGVPPGGTDLPTTTAALAQIRVAPLDR
jgi:mono/diheme cytochrome c family protein